MESLCDYFVRITKLYIKADDTTSGECFIVEVCFNVDFINVSPIVCLILHLQCMLLLEFCLQNCLLMTAKVQIQSLEVIGWWRQHVNKIVFV